MRRRAVRHAITKNAATCPVPTPVSNPLAGRAPAAERVKVAAASSGLSAAPMRADEDDEQPAQAAGDTAARVHQHETTRYHQHLRRRPGCRRHRARSERKPGNTSTRRRRGERWRRYRRPSGRRTGRALLRRSTAEGVEVGDAPREVRLLHRPHDRAFSGCPDSAACVIHAPRYESVLAAGCADCRLNVDGPTNSKHDDFSMLPRAHRVGDRFPEVKEIERESSRISV